MPPEAPRLAPTRRAVIAAAAAALAPRAALAQAAPRRGGVLTIVQATEPPMLCSAFNSSTYIGLISTKILEGLVSYDDRQQPVPLLAESWAISPDALTYTFKLRQGVTWHDGKPFGAGDVAFSAREIWSKLHPRSSVTWGALAGIDMPDEATVVFRLQRPVPFLMSMLAAWEAQVVPRHLYEGTDIRANPANNAPVGTGPFVFGEWQRGQFVRMTRNPRYWQPDRPYLDQVLIRFIPDAGARAAAFETGEVLLGFVNPIPLSDLKRVSALPGIAVDTRGYDMFAPMHLIEVNTRNPYLKDPRVRQAIMHAVDRRFILANVNYGYGKSATGPMTSTSPWYSNDGVPQYPYDVTAANRLLDEAGLQRSAGNMRFKLTHELIPSPEFSRVAEYLKQSLSRVGIELEVRASDLGTFLRRVYTEYDFGISQNFLFMLPDPSAGVQRLYYGPNIRPGVAFANASGYSNPVLDKLWEAALVEGDPAKRRAQFAEIQQIVQRDLPILNLFEMAFTTVSNRKVHDHTTGPDGAYGSMVQTWIEA